MIPDFTIYLFQGHSLKADLIAVFNGLDPQDPDEAFGALDRLSRYTTGQPVHDLDPR